MNRINFKFIPKEKQNPLYYYIDNDLKQFPNCWVYCIYSPRGDGKTYSVLDLLRRSGIRFVYLKRTNDDVRRLCAGSNTNNKATIDLSPFKPINRDKHTNIRCVQIDDGIAGFYDVEIDDETGAINPVGTPYGYVLSVNAIAKYKGFNLDECDVVVYDEFIPMPWERVLRSEGKAILSLYNTLTRDRIERGLPEIKLICLANASDITNQLFDILEIIDDVVMLEKDNKKFYHNAERGILVHRITENEFPDKSKKKTGIQKAMENTTFGNVEFGGQFAFNNLSIIKKDRLNGYKPVCSFKHHTKIFYVYRKNGDYYVTDIKHDLKQKYYDLDDEIAAIQFWVNYGFDIRVALFEGHCVCASYTAYNIILNFKKYYKTT